MSKAPHTHPHAHTRHNSAVGCGEFEECELQHLAAAAIQSVHRLLIYWLLRNNVTSFKSIDSPHLIKHWNNSQLRMCSAASGCVVSECSLIPVTVCPCVNKTRRWCFELSFPDAPWWGSKPPEEPQRGTGYIEYPSSPKPTGSMVDTGDQSPVLYPDQCFSGIRGKCAEWVQRWHNPRDQRQSIARSSVRPDSKGTSAERKWQANLEAKWCLIQGWRVGGKEKRKGG